MPVTRLDGDAAGYTAHDLRDAEERRRERTKLLTFLQPAARVDGDLTRIARAWRDHAVVVLSGTRGLQMAVQRLGERYFGGHPLLFEREAEQITGQAEMADRLVSVFNEAVATAPAWTPVEDGAQPLAIDMKALGVSADEEAAAVVRFLVDLAKSDVLDDLGERDAALKLMEPYLDGP